MLVWQKEANSMKVRIRSFSYLKCDTPILLLYPPQFHRIRILWRLLGKHCRFLIKDSSNLHIHLPNLLDVTKQHSFNMCNNGLRQGKSARVNSNVELATPQATLKRALMKLSVLIGLNTLTTLIFFELPEKGAFTILSKLQN